MSTNPALLSHERVIPDWLKSGALATFVVVACWGCVISYWRTTGSNPQAKDIFLYMLGLPACLLLLCFAGRKLFSRAIPAAAATSCAPVLANAAPARHMPLAIIGASLRLPHGASPEELASAMAGNKARADLDKELVDDDGFPVMTARSSEAVDEVLQEEIAEWLALNGLADVHFNDEQWRALTLASAVVAELAAHAAGPLLYQVETQAKLQLVPILPTEWEREHRETANIWLKHTVARYGWPADRIVLAMEDKSPSAALKQLAHGAAPVDEPVIAMVVACASDIGDETVARWAAGKFLFTASHPQGQIPGEGAVGLSVTNRSSLAQASTVVLLDGVEEANRNSSADEVKRSEPGIFKELIERACKGSGIVASEVAMLLADTGHRSSRVLELMEQVSVGCPQLDETDDVLRVGVASGTCGAVPFMAALALGRYYVTERGAPVLCVSNEDPYRRVVAVVRSSDTPSTAE
ncbi:hypothetical protein ACFQ09_25190 [Massilia norwichensis]|uniref:Transmembrane protein n=1 Tax=Massilia norwichensis TaxID=1442366 RepID=A0ABT2ABQ8_9BURK|nr:hypothetical protein [Massilia norwichensis]MCS0591648.1 hypothetical protein [Massilia norwichensis]